MAAVLAATFHPWYEQLTLRLRGHRTIAAALITITLVVALVLPIVTLGVVAIRETVEKLDSFHQILAAEGVDGLIHRIPEPVQSTVERIWQQMPRRERNSQFVFNLEARAASWIPYLLNVSGQILVQAVLMVIALYFLLLDGSRLLVWLNTVSPLNKTQIRELFTEFRRVSTTVLVGSLVTAAAQAAMALVGYLIARTPNPYFFALLTFFIGLIPILGAGGVSFAVAVYLYLLGHLYAAIFLAIWSVFVVGLVDNVVKPLVIKGGIEMHGAIVFFALLGGLAVFGPIGLVLGPLSVAFLLACLRIYHRDFGRSEAAPA